MYEQSKSEKTHGTVYDWTFGITEI